MRNVTAYGYMAKRKPAGDGATLSYPATTAYKQWVRLELKRRRWSLQVFADRLKRAGAKTTTSALSQFLGREDETPKPSNTALMPAMNEVLGIAPPPVCDPTDELAQLVDRVRKGFGDLSPREQRLVISIFSDEKTESPTIRGQSGS